MKLFSWVYINQSNTLGNYLVKDDSQHNGFLNFRPEMLPTQYWI